MVVGKEVYILYINYILPIGLSNDSMPYILGDLLCPNEPNMRKSSKLTILYVFSIKSDELTFFVIKI